MTKAFLVRFVSAKEKEGTKGEKGRALIVSQATQAHQAPNEEMLVTMNQPAA